MMKAELINFEIWFTNSEDRNQKEIDILTVHHVINDVRKAINEKKINTVVGMLCIDGFLNRDTENFYNVLKQIEIESKKLGISKIYLLVGLCHGYQKELDIRNIDIEIIDFHINVNTVFYAYQNVHDNIKFWNPNTERFLFPTGVPDRPNRIGMIKRLYQSGLLQSSGIYSFFPPWTKDDENWCRNYCNDFTDEEYDNFLKSCKNKLDEKYENGKQYAKSNGKEWLEKEMNNLDLVKNFAYIEPKFYENTSISLVSEGCEGIKQKNFFTEKIWRTIYNNHPFILLESPERYHYAKSLGLRTFENYFEYEQCHSEEVRLDKLTKSVEKFLENIPIYEKQIKDDIDTNKKIFIQYKQEIDNILDWLENDLHVDRQVIDYFLRTTDYSPFIRVVERLQ